MSNNNEYVDLREVPPAGSGIIKAIKSKHLLTNIRHWLLRKIAGNRIVIINAHLRMIPRDEDTNIVCRTNPMGKGMLLHDSNFYCTDKQMMLINNTKLVS